MPRQRLPQRRHAFTEVITTARGKEAIASIGLHPETLRPMEIFLTGEKDGADMASVLDDISVVISVALQHGITAREMAHSVSPNRASFVGAALELIAGFEEEGPDYRLRVPSLRLVP